MSHPAIDRLRSRTRGRGQHRAVDRVIQLEAALDQERARSADLWRQLDTAKDGWDAANAKASQLRDAQLRAAEATRQLADRDAEIAALKAALANVTAVSDRPARAAVTETQPIPVVVPLHLSPLAGDTDSTRTPRWPW